MAILTDAETLFAPAPHPPSAKGPFRQLKEGWATRRASCGFSIGCYVKIEIPTNPPASPLQLLVRLLDPLQSLQTKWRHVTVFGSVCL